MPGRDDNDDREVYVSIVALIISLIALNATVLQVLQTYFASSAAGFARCGVKTMGEWGKYTKRKFKVSDLRFEVEFETPVIFLAPPNNNKGPIPHEPIWYVDGTRKSYEETRTLLPNDDREQRERRSRKELIHTADNERASWVDLLAAIQKMEYDSTEWQSRFYLHNPGNKPPQVFQERTLAVAVQKKIKSWDTMPQSMTKPYATSAICHIIELAAVLGLHWKEFSRSSERYRAEGNGYMLTGAPVSDLGLVFTFQKTGRTLFGENRVIPKDEIKQLCFGVVPTIFCNSPETEERLKFPFDQPEDLAALQLGSAREIVDTFTVIGCNANTANCFLEDDKVTSHLFPVAFEILGMLGRTLHASGSGFRMLPNPTVYHWEKKSFSMWKLLHAYQDKIEDTDSIPENDQILKIKKNLDLIFKARGPERPESEFTVPILDALHQSLDSVDDYFTIIQDYLIVGILRVHFEAVLQLMNEMTAAATEGDRGEQEDDRGREPDWGGMGVDWGEERNPFDRLNNATPEQKQIDFMSIYFDRIRPKAVKTAPKRRFTTPMTTSTTTTTNATTYIYSEKPTPTKDDDDFRTLVPLRQQTGLGGGGGFDEDKLTTIWCSLVFRMLCWLLLHDFHKNDVQISKSELLGSRLPVYIV